MAAEAAYLDSSAFVKLPKPETESAALETFLATWPRWTSSALLRSEMLRALGRMGETYVVAGRAWLRDLILIDIDLTILERAGLLEPPALRTLDAIHLATALSLGDDLGVIVTYDQRMLQAAGTMGLPVASPA